MSNPCGETHAVRPSQSEARRPLPGRASRQQTCSLSSSQKIPFSERPVIWKPYNSLLSSGWHRPGKVTVQEDGILPQMLWKSEELGLPSGELCWAGVRSQASLRVSPLCSQAVLHHSPHSSSAMCPQIISSLGVFIVCQLSDSRHTPP